MIKTNAAPPAHSQNVMGLSQTGRVNAPYQKLSAGIVGTSEQGIGGSELDDSLSSSAAVGDLAVSGGQQGAATPSHAQQQSSAPVVKSLMDTEYGPEMGLPPRQFFNSAHRYISHFSC